MSTLEQSRYLATAIPGPRSQELIDRKVSVSIKEIKNPDLDAQLISMDIGEQLKRRASFRRARRDRAAR